MQSGTLESSAPSVPSFVQLPEDFPTRVRSVDLRGAEEGRHERRIETLASIVDAPGQAVFLGALCALLYRYTHQEQIPLDVVSVTDGAKDAARRIALTVAIAGDDAVSAIVARIAETMATHPLPAPHCATPRSNVAVTFKRGARATESSADTGTVHSDSSYALHFIAFTGRDTPTVVVRYDARKFDASTIEGMLESFADLLDAVLQDSEAPVHRLPLQSAVAVRALMADWSEPSVSPEDVLPAHRAFEGWARRQPDAVAARFDGTTLHYGELEKRSNRLAHYLLARGVGPGARVAVCVLPSFDVLVALLAVLKVGAIYVPLDPTHPKALTTSILEEAQPKVVLTQAALRDGLCRDRFEQFCFDATDDGLTLPDHVPSVEVGPDQPSHLFYTSGTTGRPKGVLATHRNLSHYVFAAREKYAFGPSDVFCALARYTFSISLLELLSPLVCGGTLVVLSRDDVLSPERLARTLEQVTVVHAGPSLLGNLFRHLAAHSPSGEVRTFPKMRHASSGGDLVPPHLVEEMKRVFTNAELYVIYGCTEISCMGCTYQVPRQESVTRNLVGRPFSDVTARVLDAHGNVVPFGVKGEICFSGNGVVQGYFERPELTREKFADIEGRRFYRTGDLGRLHSDGNLEILGRRDFQVQIRGIRVELAGIENTIRERQLASQCAVVARRLDDQDVRLVAFVVAPVVDDLASFRRALADVLPDYMLPQKLVVMDTLPVTHNGKLDRRRLEEMPWDARGETRVKALPRNTLERQIADAFVATLNLKNVESVGLDDDFFDLGGHSLLAVVLLEHLEDKLGLSLPPAVLFETPTVRGLAERSARSFPDAARPIELCPGPRGPLFLLAGVHVYRALARRLEGRYATFGVYVGRELLSFESPEEAPSIPELAREYLDIVRRRQPVGPYRIAGLSFGGIVAYEVARQLEATGERVEFLGLLDAILPEHGFRGQLSRLRRLATLDRGALANALAKRGLLRSGRKRRQDLERSLIRYTEDERLRPMEDKRQLAYRRAAAAYATCVKPYRGPTTLIVAGRRARADLLHDPSCGWSSHIPTLDVHTLDSEHLELLEAPHVDTVATLFLEAMSRQNETSTDDVRRTGE